MSTEVKKHAILGASKAKRWLSCPGSVELEAKAPEQPEGPYAKEGTDAHSCVEVLLKNPNQMLTTEEFLRKKYGLQMVSHAASATRWILQQKPKGAELLVEAKVDLTWIDPDMWGTLDAAIVEPFGVLHAIDFKYGAGVIVEPEENEQLIYYALAIAHKYHYNFERVLITVIQPRADHESGKTTRTWETTIDRLKEWATIFKQGAKMARTKNPPLVYGKEWCRFCPARVICPVLSDQALKEAAIDFDDDTGALALPVVTATKKQPIPRLGLVLDACDKIEAWIASVRTHAAHILETGGQVEGYKLVQKRSTRKWIDEDLAAKRAKFTFGTAAFTQPELLSPAQLEKSVGKKKAEVFVAKFTASVSSGTRLAKASEEGESIDQMAIDFPDLERHEKEVKSEVVKTLKRSKK